LEFRRVLFRSGVVPRGARVAQIVGEIARGASAAFDGFRLDSVSRRHHGLPAVPGGESSGGPLTRRMTRWCDAVPAAAVSSAGEVFASAKAVVVASVRTAPQIGRAHV